MQLAANSSLVLTDLSSLKRFADSQGAISYSGFYQLIVPGLIRSVHEEKVLRELGDRLIVLAEHAHAFREMEGLGHVSQILVSLPLPRQYNAVGRYYQALCIQRFGRGDVERPVSLFELAVENAPPQYRVRAIISLSANAFYKRDYESTARLCDEASRLASRNDLCDPYATLHIQRMSALINSEDGNHSGSVALLENLFPLARTISRWHPHVYYDYMNSLAVELCEVGRLEEASNISQIVLASPFAPAYPEWSDTNGEIALRSRRASRSVVAISQWNPESDNQSTSQTGNLVQMIAARRSDIAETRDTVAAPTKQRASVVNLLEWKNEVNERKGILKDRQTRLKELKKLPTEDKIAEIWGRLGDEDVDDDLLCEALLLLEDYQPEENQGS